MPPLFSVVNYLYIFSNSDVGESLHSFLFILHPSQISVGRYLQEVAVSTSVKLRFIAMDFTLEELHS